MEIDFVTPVPVHVSLEPKLYLLGLRLVHPTYLPAGRHVVSVLLDVVGNTVEVGRGQCLLVLDSRNKRQRFFINDSELYKDCEE